MRDLPVPERLSYEECRKRAAEGARRYWESERPIREARREAVRSAAAASIGSLTERETLIAGAIAYWCEGAKSKPYDRREQVMFINSDPDLIRLFLRFLSVAGADPATITYRVMIHETADAEAAQSFWQSVTKADPAQFSRPTLKRHNPKTVRKNVGDDYHGCLIVRVRRGAELYQKIEGWTRAATASAGGASPPAGLAPAG